MTLMGIDRTANFRLSRGRIALLFTLFVLICIATDRSSNAQSTNIAVGTTVKVSPTKRLGVNLATQNYYDSGQMLRNLLYRNPGFEGETWQSVLKCVAVTATTCTDANVWNVWPAGFLNGGSYEVVNGAAEGETGTITSDAGSDFAAGNINSPTYGLKIGFSAPAIPIAIGDYIIVRQQIPGNALAGWLTYSYGGGSFSTETSDIASDSPGVQALEISAPQSSQVAEVIGAFDTWPGRSFVRMNGTYTVGFKAKALSGSKQVSVSVIRLGQPALFSQAVSLTDSWKDYSFSFNATDVPASIGSPVQVQFSVSGGVVLLDDASFNEAAAPGNPTGFRNAVVSTLKTLQPGVLRYMELTNFGTSIDNEIAVPFARKRAGNSSQQSEMDDVPMGLEEFLVLCQTVGAEPWYAMPGEMDPVEMQHLIDFLAGSTSTTYGAKRAALGQTAPWTTVFPVIHLELGNEMWNTVLQGEDIPDPVVYGNRAAKIFAAARSTASYNASKFDLVLGSFAVNPSYTQTEMANSSGYDSVDAAPYLFYSLTDVSSNEAIFGPMFAQPEQIDSTSGGYMAQQLKAANGGSTPAKLAVYEVNLSTDSGSAPQAMVTAAAGGLGSGLAVADHMLLMMRDLGITTQSMFALSEYQTSFNSSVPGQTSPLWGSVIDMGGETDAQRPTFLAEELANSAILPTMLATTVTGANPTWNQATSTNDGVQLANAHYLQSFAFTDGTNKSVIVFNLSRTSALPVTFSGSNAPTGSVLIGQLTSKNPTDNNEYLTTNNPVVFLTHTNATNFNPATPYSLPPYSMTVFRWPGATLPASKTVLTTSVSSAAEGTPVHLTVNVSSADGNQPPTGQVAFLDNGVVFGSSTFKPTGEATYTANALPLGKNVLTAVYAGDADDASSQSASVTVTITQ
jgi:hypothetical protein